MQVLFAIARVLLVLIFIVSGGRKLLDLQAAAGSIEQVLVIPSMANDLVAQLQDATGQKISYLLALLAGVVEVVGGLLIAFNIGTRGAALILAIFTLVATYYFHAFWTMTGEAMQTNMVQALKNLSIVGGLLTLVALGAWRPVRPDQI